MEKLTVKTTILQDLVAKSVRGAGNNKLLPITSLMEISVSEDDYLVLQTTDSTNYLFVRNKIDNPNRSFYVVVPADTFAKLVGKITTPTIDLEVSDGKLFIEGNGSYVIPLPLDEEGKPIVFPDLKYGIGNLACSIPLYTVQTILNSVKSALSPTIDVPCYMNYYMGSDIVVATDTIKINALVHQKFMDQPILLNPEMMNLLSIMSDDVINVYLGDAIKFEDSHCIVIGRIPDGIEDYQINEIGGLLDTEFKSMIEFSKQDILQSLDRLSLFVDTYDKNGIQMVIHPKEGETLFEDCDFTLSSLVGDGIESLPLISATNPVDFNGVIDVFDFQAQVKSIASDRVEFWYGPDNAIKLTDGNVVHIIALILD